MFNEEELGRNLAVQFYASTSCNFSNENLFNNHKHEDEFSSSIL